MVWTRKSEAERDSDEIELATEKVSLPSFSFFLLPPLFIFLSSQLLLSPALPLSFSPLVHKRICTRPSTRLFPTSTRRVFVHTRRSRKHVVSGQSAIFMDAIYVPYSTFPLEPALCDTLYHLVPREKG